jgi:hypothetical protein
MQTKLVPTSKSIHKFDDLLDPLEWGNVYYVCVLNTLDSFNVHFLRWTHGNNKGIRSHDDFHVVT